MSWDRYNSQGGRGLPSNWGSLSKSVKQRDGHRCVKCGSTDRLEVDHIVDPDDHRPENLQTLCHECHANKTHREARLTRYGLRKGRRQLRFEQHPGMRT